MCIDKIIKDSDFIYEQANECAKLFKNFNRPTKAGLGNRITNQYVQRLNERLACRPGITPQKAVSDGADSAVDYYIEKEAMIIEVALSIRNPNSEFYKDVFKACIAKGKWSGGVKRLLFISKKGGEQRLNQPLHKMVQAWSKEQGIEIVVKDLCV